MHELAIATSMIQQAERHAKNAGATRVNRLCCSIGAFRQIEDDLVRDAFAIAREGTICDGATLTIERIPIRGQCPTCRTVFSIQNWNWTCPNCGKEAELLPGGDELELTSIDVEAES